MEIKPRTFDKKKVIVDEDGKQSIGDDPAAPSHGYVAQELKHIFPEFVNGDETKEYLSVSEGKVCIALLAAFQEFVRETRKEIAELKANAGHIS